MYDKYENHYILFNDFMNNSNRFVYAMYSYLYIFISLVEKSCTFITLLWNPY